MEQTRCREWFHEECVTLHIPSVTVAFIYPYRCGQADVCAYLVEVGANPSTDKKITTW